MKKEKKSTSKKLFIKGALMFDITLDSETGYEMANNTTIENMFAVAAVFKSILLQKRDVLGKKNAEYAEITKAMNQCDKVTQDLGHHLLQTKKQEDYDVANASLPKSKKKGETTIKLLK